METVRFVDFCVLVLSEKCALQYATENLVKNYCAFHRPVLILNPPSIPVRPINKTRCVWNGICQVR